jgi:hypothetical protein
MCSSAGLNYFLVQLTKLTGGLAAHLQKALTTDRTPKVQFLKELLGFILVYNSSKTACGLSRPESKENRLQITDESHWARKLVSDYCISFTFMEPALLRTVVVSRVTYWCLFVEIGWNFLVNWFQWRASVIKMINFWPPPNQRLSHLADACWKLLRAHPVFCSAERNSLRPRMEAAIRRRAESEMKPERLVSGPHVARELSWPGSATGRQSAKWTSHRPIDCIPALNNWPLQRAAIKQGLVLGT